MTVDEWLAAAREDAERRGLADLAPLLESLAESTRALRRAGWERLAPGPEPPGVAATPGPSAHGSSR
jgi:hypothetical protein